MIDSDLQKAIQIISSQNNTPYYLFSEEVIHNSYMNIYNSFRKFWPQVSIAYSYKTNPLLAICRLLHNWGALAEVTSAHEINIARAVKASRLIFNGIYKTKIELREAIMSGNTLINIDGWQQLEQVCELSLELNRGLEIGLRFTPDAIKSNRWDKFGFSSDIASLHRIVNTISKAKINIIGLHCHSGTNISDPAVYELQASLLGKIKQFFKGQGIEIEIIDIGGGFVSTDNIEKYELYASAALQGFSKFFSADEVELVLEPGRALVEQSAVLVTKVLDVIARPEFERPYLIIDGGTNLAMGVDLVGSRSLARLGINQGAMDSYDVMGPLCTQSDIISVEAVLPVCKPGDYVVIRDVGAYDVSTAYPFIRLRPPVYLYKKTGETVMIRSEETSEFVFSLEQHHD